MTVVAESDLTPDKLCFCSPLCKLCKDWTKFLCRTSIYSFRFKRPHSSNSCKDFASMVLDIPEIFRFKSEQRICQKRIPCSFLHVLHSICQVATEQDFYQIIRRAFDIKWANKPGRKYKRGNVFGLFWVPHTLGSYINKFALL